MIGSKFNKLDSQEDYNDWREGMQEIKDSWREAERDIKQEHDFSDNNKDEDNRDWKLDSLCNDLGREFN